MNGSQFFLGGLTLLFIGLKLGEVIDWSWWLVLLPIYGPFAVVMVFSIAIFIVVAVVGTIVWAYERLDWRKP